MPTAAEQVERPAAGAGATAVRRLRDGRLLIGPPARAGQPCAACVEARLAAHGIVSERASVRDAGLSQLAAPPPPDGHILSWDGRAFAPHLLLPVPGCGCGNGWRPPASLSLADAVDPLTGIVAHVDLHDFPDADGATATLALARPCRLAALGRLPSIIEGAGFGASGHAWTAAVAETLERYCASFFPDDLPIGPAAALGAEHLPVSNASFGGEPVGWDQPVRWVQGERLADGRPCFVQASAVYFPYPCADVEPRRSRGGSEGLAAGATRADAIRHATLELIERDSFIRAWRFDGPRREIPSPFAGPHALRFVALPNRFGVPVVVAFLEADDIPYCTAGIAARLDLAEAIDAAAREAIGARALDLVIGRSAAGSAEARHAHALDPALRAVRDAWRRGGPPSGGAVLPPADWTDLTRRLPDAVAVDVTTPDVSALGVTVVRVVIPGLFGSEPVPGMSRLGGNPAPTPF